VADNFRSAIARVYKIGDSKGIKHRKLAMLWLFQVFALTAGLYGCQVWATSSLTLLPQKSPPHMSFTSRLPEKPGFLIRLLKAFVNFVNFEKTPGCQERY
jgi:hypothetical protein